MEVSACSMSVVRPDAANVPTVPQYQVRNRWLLASIFIGGVLLSVIVFAGISQDFSFGHGVDVSISAETTTDAVSKPRLLGDYPYRRRQFVRSRTKTSNSETAATNTTAADPALDEIPRKGSFLVIGDWGFDSDIHGGTQRPECQQRIANLMLDKMRELGDVKFIINVGDSFYPRGVTSKIDPQWDTKWRNIYAEELRSVPWLSVYGNHDYLTDPCTCSLRKQCAQFNADINNLNFFYMPDHSYYLDIPDLGVEVVALDYTQYMWAVGNRVPKNKRCPLDCAYSPCQKMCEARIKLNSKKAHKLFDERMKESKATSLLVFSHYPTDYLWWSSRATVRRVFKSRNADHIAYFGGHRHSVDNTTTLFPHKNNWLVGGGGGWSCDTRKQGFLVGEIGMQSEISTYPVLIDHTACCQKAPWKPHKKYPEHFCKFPLGR